MMSAETDLLVARNLAAASIGDVAVQFRRARTSISDGASATIRKVSAHTISKMGRAIAGAIAGADSLKPNAAAVMQVGSLDAAVAPSLLTP